MSYEDYVNLLSGAMREDIENQIYYELMKELKPNEEHIPPVRTAPALFDIISERIEKDVRDAFYRI